MAYTCSLADDRYSGTLHSKSAYPRDGRHDENLDKPWSRRQGIGWSSAMGATSTHSGVICPLHGEGGIDLREDPPPPPELVATAGHPSCRYRDPFTYKRRAWWCDPSKASGSVYKNDQLASERVPSPGYGWAEPGKGWTRCSSRSRSREKSAAWRSCPRRGGRQDPRESPGVVQQEQFTQVPSAPLSRVGTAKRNCDRHPERYKHLELTAATMDDTSRQRSGMPCGRDKAWAVSYLSGEDAVPQPTRHDAAREIVGQYEHQPRVVATAPISTIGPERWKNCLGEARTMKHVRRL